MATLSVILPLFNETAYSYSISLEGNSYFLEYYFNEKVGLYYLNILDADSVPVVMGVALVPTYPITLDYVLPDLSGWFWLNKKSESLGEPYKEFPDRLDQYYDFFYSRVTED